MITLTVTDGDGGTAAATAAVAVANVDPTAAITGPAAGSLYALGATADFAGMLDDVGALDTHTATGTLDGSAFGAAPITLTGTVDQVTRQIAASPG